METLTTKQFEAIYREYHDKIFTHIAIRVKNREQVEELTNDVFVKVHRFYSLYNADKGQFNTWLYNVANNIVIDHWRENEKKVKCTDTALFTDDGEAKEFYSLSTNETPLAVIVRKQEHENVQKRMSALPKKLRDVATLFFNEQLSHDEICTCLDLPLGTVKGYIYRAREILKEQLSYA